MLDAQKLKEGLAHFTGTEHWFRHSVARSVLYTDGAQFVAENAEAYWLLDEIAFANQFNPTVQAEPFQAWTLKVDPTGRARLVCEDGDGNQVFAKAIPYTDFPLPEIALWVETDGEHKVILLPSEH